MPPGQHRHLAGNAAGQPCRRPPRRGRTPWPAIIAAAAAVPLWVVSPPAGSAGTPDADPAVGRIIAVAADVEQTAARTRPMSWPLRRACLYYALAGQYLLARQGIEARPRLGAVVYDPGTPAAHRISPHAWLETPTLFVDYATLPRRGRVTVLTLDHVAADAGDVIPGRTRVLAVAESGNPSLRAYFAVHRARFLRLMMQLHGPVSARPSAGRAGMISAPGAARR